MRSVAPSRLPPTRMGRKQPLAGDLPLSTPDSARKLDSSSNEIEAASPLDPSVTCPRRSGVASESAPLSLV